MHCAPVQTDVQQIPEASPRRPLREFATRVISVVANALENRPNRAIEDQMEKGLLSIVNGESEAAQVDPIGQWKIKWKMHCRHWSVVH